MLLIITKSQKFMVKENVEMIQKAIGKDFSYIVAGDGCYEDEGWLIEIPTANVDLFSFKHCDFPLKSKRERTGY